MQKARVAIRVKAESWRVTTPDVTKRPEAFALN